MKAILTYNRTLTATVIAVIFHTVGLCGMLFFDPVFFASLTPFNLLLSFALIVWVQESKNSDFFFFIFGCYVVGFLVEYLGVNHQLLFGEYRYVSLGITWAEVPLIIGVNWFIILFSCGVTTVWLLKFVENNKWVGALLRLPGMRVFLFLILGAWMATLFDWLMEPVAVRLNYWKWLKDGSIPLYNYICWFVVSFLLLILFKMLSFDQSNRFAMRLFVIQFLFFFILRVAL